MIMHSMIEPLYLLFRCSGTCKEQCIRTIFKTSGTRLLKDVGMTVLKTIETRMLYADKGKDIWHEKQGAV